MKTKSILTKTIAVAALSLAGIGAINQLDNNEAQAAVVQNDAVVYTTTQATTVYNNYENPVATGQTLAAGTNWKIIKTAYDSKGQKWYDLGLNQWVLATSYTTSQNTQARQENSQSSYADSNANYTHKATTTSSYSSTATGSEASAKAWIASKESGGSYSARNGQYVGKYQLSSSYLNGDYSAANQERVADNYVKSRYGSWSAAKNFWQANGWY